MYFPYLRGKQFELLALKELSQLLGTQKKVIPIIEPVRSPEGSGLDRCLTALTGAGVDFVLVMNPSVGDLQVDDIRNPLVVDELVGYVTGQQGPAPWNLGLLLHEGSDAPAVIADYTTRVGQGRRLTLIHRGLAASLAEVPALTANLQCENNVIDDSLRRRHFNALLQNSNPVTLHDGFPREERNSAYLDRTQSIFCEDHLYLTEENWFGFADFLTIGEPYADGGFTPRAVAIHWTYEPKPGNPIMIRHFTSESNADTTNVGGKFLEAAGKLVTFLDARSIHTQASEVMRGHVANSTYPGLGIVKKLSIQNHLELVSGILSRP